MWRVTLAVAGVTAVLLFPRAVAAQDATSTPGAADNPEALVVDTPPQGFRLVDDGELTGERLRQLEVVDAQALRAAAQASGWVTTWQRDDPFGRLSAGVLIYPDAIAATRALDDLRSLAHGDRTAFDVTSVDDAFGMQGASFVDLRPEALVAFTVGPQLYVVTQAGDSPDTALALSTAARQADLATSRSQATTARAATDHLVLYVAAGAVALLVVVLVGQAVLSRRRRRHRRAASLRNPWPDGPGPGLPARPSSTGRPRLRDPLDAPPPTGDPEVDVVNRARTRLAPADPGYEKWKAEQTEQAKREQRRRRR